MFSRRVMWLRKIICISLGVISFCGLTRFVTLVLGFSHRWQVSVYKLWNCKRSVIMPARTRQVMASRDSKEINKSPHVIIVGAGYALDCFFFWIYFVELLSLSLGQQTCRNFSCYPAQMSAWLWEFYREFSCYGVWLEWLEFNRYSKEQAPSAGLGEWVLWILLLVYKSFNLIAG